MLFCPSNSLKDWLVNILGFLPILQFPFFYCIGWKKVYDACSLQIFEELSRTININKDYTVEICGHSYGGAMSIICGIDLYKKTRVKADVITFGSPRPLIFFISSILARFCLNSVTQYAHRSDVVTYCPPLLSYYNVKVKRIGKFSVKGLFDPNKYHLIYDDVSLYE